MEGDAFFGEYLTSPSERRPRITVHIHAAHHAHAARAQQPTAELDGSE